MIFGFWVRGSSVILTIVSSSGYSKSTCNKVDESNNRQWYRGSQQGTDAHINPSSTTYQTYNSMSITINLYSYISRFTYLITCDIISSCTIIKLWLHNVMYNLRATHNILIFTCKSMYRYYYYYCYYCRR